MDSSLFTSRWVDLPYGMTFGSVSNHILPYLIVSETRRMPVLTHYVVQHYVEHESLIHDLNGSVYTIM